MMMNDRRFVEVIIECETNMYLYMCMRSNESADHRNPYPACTKRALRRSLYAGGKIAVTIAFQQFVTCGIESYQLSRFKWRFFDKFFIYLSKILYTINS